MSMVLAQGIQLFEDIPWKTIAVPAIVLGFIVTIVDFTARTIQTRQQYKLVKDIRDAVARMHDMTDDIRRIGDDLLETLLSR